MIIRRSIQLLLATTFCAGALQARAQRVADGMVAVVNATPVTQQQVERYIGQEEQFLLDQYSAKPETLYKKITALRETGTEALITREVILKDAQDTMKVPQSIIDEYVQERIKDRYPDSVALTKQLQLQGITMDQLRKQFRDQLILEQMRLKNVPEPIISPRKVETYYLKHREDFKVADQIKMRMIVLNKSGSAPADSVKKRAEEILSQVNSGAAFEDLARTYSEGSLRQDGGETGWEEQSVVNKTLSAEIDKLKPGQHTGVIETPDGFYILLLEDRHPTHYKPLNEVRAQVEATLSAQETDRLQTQWVERIRRKTFVKMF